VGAAEIARRKYADDVRMTPTHTKIRTATADDAATIVDFNSRLAVETEQLALDPATIDRGVRAALADPAKATYFLAEIDGAVAGQLMVTHEWSDWRNGDLWWIQSVYVADEFRRRGVFKALYDHVKTLAQRAGAAGVRLYVDRSNLKAQQTYVKLGMSMTNYLVMEEILGPE
jgi:ribosomal protein S18 acetylase RimI-like enzyme